MEKENSSEHSDDFGAFLESVQRAVQSGEMSNTSSMKIMSILSKVGEVNVVQLMTVVEMRWSEFSAGITSLQSAGLVMVDETETSQGGKVQLTPDGKRWANALVSPADDEAV